VAQGKVVSRETLDELLEELMARSRGQDGGPTEAHWQVSESYVYSICKLYSIIAVILMID
jgi:hypothetical protein